MNHDYARVSSGSPFEPQIGFSRAVRSGSCIAVSGTAPIGSDGTTAHVGDLYGQTRRCLEIMIRAIEEAGGSIRDVIRTRVMLIDVGQWREAARAHGEVFGDVRPASTFVQVAAFIDPQWLVETEADCVLRSVAQAERQLPVSNTRSSFATNLAGQHRTTSVNRVDQAIEQSRFPLARAETRSAGSSPLAGFQIVTEISVLWSDEDSFAHVNNVAYLRWCETARVEYLKRIGFFPELPAQGVGPIIASATCHYRRALKYPDTVAVGTRVTAIGNSSFRMEHRILSRGAGEIAAEVDSAMVAVDYTTGKPVRLPEQIREAIARLEESR